MDILSRHLNEKAGLAHGFLMGSRTPVRTSAAAEHNACRRHASIYRATIKISTIEALELSITYAKSFQTTGDMADCSVDKREATILDDSHRQPPNKTPWLGHYPIKTANLTVTSVDTMKLFNRPLQEQPTLSYDDLIEDVQEELKNMKEKGVRVAASRYQGPYGLPGQQ